MRSLLDQLQESGLVSEEDAKKTEQQRNNKPAKRGSSTQGKKSHPHAANKKAGRNGQKKAVSTQPIDKPSIAEKYFADDLNKQIAVRDLLKKRGQNQHSAKQEFNFVVEGETHINAVATTPQQKQMLLVGELAIARPLSPRDEFVLLRAKDASALLFLEEKRVLFWEATGELDIPASVQEAMKEKAAEKTESAKTDE